MTSLRLTCGRSDEDQQTEELPDVLSVPRSGLILERPEAIEPTSIEVRNVDQVTLAKLFGNPGDPASTLPAAVCVPRTADRGDVDSWQVDWIDRIAGRDGCWSPLSRDD